MTTTKTTPSPHSQNPRWIMLLAAFLPFSASAQPFEPARVADQANVTIEMLEEEAEQFIQQGKIKQADFNAPQLQRNLDQTLVDLKRAEDLYKSQTISLEELRAAQTNVEQARATIEINRAGRQTAVSRSLVAKYKILEQGQPGLSSYVLQAAEAQLDYLIALQTLYARAKDKADNDLRLAQFLEENAAKLVESGAITRIEFDRRVLARQKAMNALQNATAELEAFTPAVEAARQTVAKLQER
jgi:hypothetical protein